LDQLLARAFAALTPGRRIVLHDFMVDDDGSGPATAALWLVNALLIDPDVARLSPVIPGITRSLTAIKPER
jgi:2-hydroxy-4-(methylsulfanyl)butanoate S-methyltransferase